MQKTEAVLSSQVIENKRNLQRPDNCYIQSASDVPAAGKNSGQPREQQDPGKSHRLRSGPSKGETGRERPAEGAADITAVLKRLGRPVTSAGQQNATPFGSGVLCFRSHFSSQITEFSECLPQTTLASRDACL
jgi:hypothetical protein